MSGFPLSFLERNIFESLAVECWIEEFCLVVKRVLLLFGVFLLLLSDGGCWFRRVDWGHDDEYRRFRSVRLECFW